MQSILGNVGRPGFVPPRKECTRYHDSLLTNNQTRPHRLDEPSLQGCLKQQGPAQVYLSQLIESLNDKIEIPADVKTLTSLQGRLFLLLFLLFQPL